MANDNKQAQAEKPKKRSRVKETFAELKKVTWPTFGKTMKQTGAVFVVTIFFLVILLIMDQLLGLAHSRLSEGLKAPVEETVMAFKAAVGGFKNFTGSLFSGSAVPLII